MTVRRNDPCPCGSGKKYKKCCLAADEGKIPAAVEPPHAKRAPVQPAAPVSPPRPSKPEPVDPRQAAINQALDQRRKAKESLSRLLKPIRGLLSRDADDPRLMEALDTWAT